MIEAVLFDLDDTLHDDTASLLCAAEETATNIARKQAVDPVRLQNAFLNGIERYWDAYNSESAREVANPRQSMWASALREVGIEDQALAAASAAIFEENRKRHYRLFDGVADFLTELRTRGFKLGLLTNGRRSTHADKIIALQLEKHFDAIFLSDELGLAKPDPRVFNHACQRLEVRPANTIMVGDRYDRDIIGAQQAGLLSIWFSRSGQIELEPGKLAATATVTTIPLLREVILSICGNTAIPPT